MRSIFITFTLAALVACGSEEEHGAEACLAAKSTTSTALDARTGTVTVSLSETPFEISLPAGKKGHARLTTTTDTALVVAFKQSGVPITVTGPAAVALAAPAALEACATDVPAHYDLDLETPGDYVFALGPVAGDKVWMFLHEEAHAHE